MAKRKHSTAAKKHQSANHFLPANRKYKDTVFRMLFADKTNLLSLYNAMNGSSYQNPSELQIVTLENAIYMGMKNDLAFLIDTNLFLYEHQSTDNPNMPLRDLFYISSEYQKLIDSNQLYSSKQLKIPAPHFVVFYNGTENQLDSWCSYLSESYTHFSGTPNLELKVVTLNIRKGHNKELMEQCQTLKEYAEYVEKVRTYAAENSLDYAVERAVTECIREGILVDFLTQNRSEVIAMSIFEYDEKKVCQLNYEDGRADGLRAGMKLGIQNMLSIGKYSLEDISEIFQIPVEEVLEIKDENVLENK